MLIDAIEGGQGTMVDHVLQFNYHKVDSREVMRLVKESDGSLNPRNVRLMSVAAKLVRKQGFFWLYRNAWSESTRREFEAMQNALRQTRFRAREKREAQRESAYARALQALSSLGKPWLQVSPKEAFYPGFLVSVQQNRVITRLLPEWTLEKRRAWLEGALSCPMTFWELVRRAPFSPDEVVNAAMLLPAILHSFVHGTLVFEQSPELWQKNDFLVTPANSVTSGVLPSDLSLTS